MGRPFELDPAPEREWWEVVDAALAYRHEGKPLPKWLTLEVASYYQGTLWWAANNLWMEIQELKGEPVRGSPAEQYWVSRVLEDREELSAVRDALGFVAHPDEEPDWVDDLDELLKGVITKYGGKGEASDLLKKAGKLPNPPYWAQKDG